LRKATREAKKRYNGNLIITSENNLKPSRILLRRNPGKMKMMNK